jgi:hypothetical protein
MNDVFVRFSQTNPMAASEPDTSPDTSDVQPFRRAA